MVISLQRRTTSAKVLNLWIYVISKLGERLASVMTNLIITRLYSSAKALRSAFPDENSLQAQSPQKLLPGGFDVLAQEVQNRHK